MTKQEAQAEARKIRAEGYTVRIVKNPDGSYDVSYYDAGYCAQYIQ